MRKSTVTFATCFLLIVVYFVEMSQGGNLLNCPAEILLRLGASTGPLTIDHAQYFRLLSCIFIHANLLHLALNIYVLLDLGPMAEASLGRKFYLFVFYYAGVIGALTSILYNPTQTSVGASAAILGLLGAVIFKTWFEKDGARFSRPQLIMLCIFLLYSLLLGFTSDWIDNAAHLGGFFSGMLACAAVYGTRGDTPSKKRALAAGGVLAILVVALIIGDDKRVIGNPDVYAFQLRTEAAALIKKKDYVPALAKLNEAQALAKNKVSAILFDRAGVLDEMKDYPPALSDITTWVGEHPKDAQALMLRAAILHKMNRDEEAIESVTRALEIKPTTLVDYFSGMMQVRAGQAMLYNNRAWFELSAGKTDKGVEDAVKSIELDKRLATAYDTRGFAFYMLKDYDKAQKDFSRSIEFNQQDIKNKKGATEDGAAYYHRALARFALGDREGGKQDMERFNSLDYKPEPWEPKP
ncbi:MAG: rhomboid family intramembrane serine protease [Cyanobacteria bacterium SZAS TMP-1]|nr:rhomboid family intramembrane serine protease [Cyanobacteria bacterium SZAS TMP-1]